MTTGAIANRTFHNPVQQDSLTFLETVAESGGARTLGEIELAPGGGNELHIHRAFDEHFEAVSGVVTVRLGGEHRRLAPGETAVAPRGTVHGFVNDTEGPVTFRIELRPGHLGFERMLQTIYGLAADGRTNAKGLPKNPYHLALLGEWGDTHLPRPRSAAEPVLRLFARRARARGIERELRERYCAW